MCVLRCKESGGGVHPHPERTVGRKGRRTKKEEAGRGGKARECCQRGASAPGARPSVARAGLFHSSNACSMEGTWPAWPIGRSVTGVWHACYRVHRRPPSAACARAGEGGEKAQEKLLCGQALPGKSSPQKGGKTEKRVGEGSRKMLARRPLAPGQFPSQAWEGENSRMDRGNTLRRGGLVSNAQGGEFDPGARLRPGDIPWRKKGGG